MTLTPEQLASLKEASRPLMLWLNEHCHPHCEAHVDQCSVEITEGLATVKNEEFLRD